MPMYKTAITILLIASFVTDISTADKIRGCKSPGNFIHGRISNAQDLVPVGQSIIFSCKSDFRLVGRSTVVCASPGRWNAPFPECISDPGNTRNRNRIRDPSPSNRNRRNSCRVPRIPKNGDISESRDYVAPGSLITFKCDRGYTLTGPADLACLTGGTWNTRVPRCQRRGRGPNNSNNECRIPSNFRNGDFEISGSGRGIDVGTVITFNCDSGYYMKGPSRLVCRRGGWDSRKPKCRRDRNNNGEKVCRKPEYVDNGDLNLPTGNSDQFPVGTVLTFTCRRGYRASEPTTLVCKRGGIWSADPNCVRTNRRNPDRNTCKIPRNIANGKLNLPSGNSNRYPVGTVLTFTCDRGYQPDGSSATMVCRSNGRWSVRNPRCRSMDRRNNDGNTCTIPSYIKNGEFNDPTGNIKNTNGRLSGPNGNSGEWPVGTVVTWACNSGFEPDGPPVMVCQAGSRWNIPNPRCVRGDNYDKGHNQDPNAQYFYPDKVGCYKGVFYDDTYERSASDRSDQGVAEGKRCRKIWPPCGGSMHPLPDRWVGHSVAFMCKPYYRMEGERMAYCRNGGYWSNGPPKCIPDSSPKYKGGDTGNMGTFANFLKNAMNAATGGR